MLKDHRSIETTQPTLDAHVSNEKIIILRLTGKFTNQYLEEFSHWSDTVKSLISERNIAGDNPILVIADLKGDTHFERKPITVVRELLNYDKQFPLRTAIISNDGNLSILLNSLISILMRKNIRQFRSESEAMFWLTAGAKR